MTRRCIQGFARFLILMTCLLAASQSQAFTLDWETIGWDPDDPSGSQIFTDVDGSGIDLSVTYTTNMFWNGGVPLLYTERTAPTDEIVGSLKFTNDHNAPIERTTVTLDFSTDVLVKSAVLYSHSIVSTHYQEHSMVVGRDAQGGAVLATDYSTSTPGLVALDADQDALYESIGLGYQTRDEYGTVYYGYEEEAIRSLAYSLWITDIGGEDYIRGSASMGIGLVDFSGLPNTVPEPGTGLLAGLGLIGLALCSRHMRPRC